MKNSNKIIKLNMYNIYIHEKNLEAKKKEKTNKEKQKKFENEHKKKNR